MLIMRGTREMDVPSSTPNHQTTDSENKLQQKKI